MEYLNKDVRPMASRYGYKGEDEFLVGYIPHKSGVYKIEIDDIITSVSQFSTAIQVLNTAKEDDEIEITLQTGGGCVNSTDALVHAMRKCAAPIHIIATGGVHSAGSWILLEADSYELSEGFNSLIHCGYDGAGGTVSEYQTKSVFDVAFRTKQFRETYAGFLTESEIDAMLKGQDIWLDAEGWYKRSLVRIEYYKAKREALEAESPPEIISQVEKKLTTVEVKRTARKKKTSTT